MVRSFVLLTLTPLGLTLLTSAASAGLIAQDLDLGSEGDQATDSLTRIADEALNELEWNPLFPIGIYSGPASERSVLSGDWGGARMDLANKGMLIQMEAVTIGSSVFDGGRDEDEELMQKFDLVFKFDTGRAGLWPGGFGSVRTEARLGNSANPNAGTLMPVNTVALFPATNAEDDTVDLTEVVFTQFLTEKISVFGGLLQTLDGDQLPGASGRGTDQFLNLAFVLNPLALLAIPYSTLGFGVGFFPSTSSYGAFFVMDTEESSGHNKFDNTGGTTIAGEWYTNYTVNECLGGFKIGGLYADHEFTDLSQDLRNFLPPGTQENDDETWAVYCNAFQAFMPSELDRYGRRRTWGVLTRFGYADDDTNPFEWFASAMLAGRGLMESRPLDHWGIGYYHLELTDQDITDLLPVSDEDGVEAFYSFALLPSVKLTFDLQYIEPGLDNVDDVWIGQLRTTIQL